ncbi:hypothetical protein HPB48_013705 [Haemaphysalis longicornis]|uniref:Uncharacterized protein n=1 Tax=Haemaphysalis longicornis TaxID=44386 RepID=A0A9J6GIN5_HAELO|nr:hypothetical protein HPB48_013705 [Haemaphysalis longicornis]
MGQAVPDKGRKERSEDLPRRITTLRIHRRGIFATKPARPRAVQYYRTRLEKRNGLSREPPPLFGGVADWVNTGVRHEDGQAGRGFKKHQGWKRIRKGASGYALVFKAAFLGVSHSAWRVLESSA